MAKLSPIIDTNTAATAIGVSKRRIQQLIKSGRLPAQIMGGSYVIQRVDLQKVRHRKPGRPKSKK